MPPRRQKTLKKAWNRSRQDDDRSPTLHCSSSSPIPAIRISARSNQSCAVCSVDRHRNTFRTPCFRVNVVAPSDTDQHPALPLEQAAQIATGDLLHTATSITWASRSFRSPSNSTERHPSIASRMLSLISSMVSPCETQPGIVGQRNHQYDDAAAYGGHRSQPKQEVLHYSPRTAYTKGTREIQRPTRPRWSRACSGSVPTQQRPTRTGQQQRSTAQPTQARQRESALRPNRSSFDAIGGVVCRPRTAFRPQRQAEHHPLQAVWRSPFCSVLHRAWCHWRLVRQCVLQGLADTGGRAHNCPVRSRIMTTG